MTATHPIADVARFTALVGSDPNGVPERLQLLVEHRRRVIAEQRRIKASLAVIDGKIADYRQRLDDAAASPANRRQAR